MSLTNDTSKNSDQDLKLPIEPGIPEQAGDQFAADLRSFGPMGLLAILIIIFSTKVYLGNIVVPIGAFLVLLWAKLSHTPWSRIGYVKPKSWIESIALGLVFGIALKLLMKAIVMPLLGADPVNQAYHYLAGNRSMLPAATWAMLVAGFAEETVFRGFAFERLGKLFGPGKWARILIVLLTSLWFGWSHYAGQGLAGMEQATITGLVFGTIFATTGRIFVIMVAHAAFDLAALAIIYWNIEPTVAHLIFK